MTIDKKTLDKCKDEIAKENGFEDWKDALEWHLSLEEPISPFDEDETPLDALMDSSALRYASQFYHTQSPIQEAGGVTKKDFKDKSYAYETAGESCYVIKVDEAFSLAQKMCQAKDMEIDEWQEKFHERVSIIDGLLDELEQLKSQAKQGGYSSIDIENAFAAGQLNQLKDLKIWSGSKEYLNSLPQVQKTMSVEEAKDKNTNCPYCDKTANKRNSLCQKHYDKFIQWSESQFQQPK